MFLKQFDGLKTSRISNPQFPKFGLLRHQSFLRIFSSSRSVLPVGLALGPRLPRLHTAYDGSLQWPRFGPRAAYRGEGGGGWEALRGPRPRTRTWGENPLEAMGSFLRSWWNVDAVQVLWILNTWLFVESVLPKHLTLIFCVVHFDPDYTVPTPWVGYVSLFMRCRTICNNICCFIQVLSTANMADMASITYKSHHVFETIRWAQDISNLKPTVSKIWTFEAPKFSQDFLLVPFGFACGLGPGAAAPEARQRCIGQPGTATSWSCSGSSRRRRRWMRRRTKTAVASDEGFGVGTLLEAMGSLREEVDEMLMVQVFSIFHDFLWKVFCQNIWHWYFVLFFAIPTILFRHLQLDSLWIDDFSLEIERHVHHNPNCSEFPERSLT